MNGRRFRKKNSSSNRGLEMIVTSDGSATTVSNRRWLQTNGKKRLKILVPDFGRFPNLIQMTVDPETNLPTPSGFCGDVFNIVFGALGYKVDIEFTRVAYEDGKTYTELIDKVYLKVRLTVRKLIL